MKACGGPRACALGSSVPPRRSANKTHPGPELIKAQRKIFHRGSRSWVSCVEGKYVEGEGRGGGRRKLVAGKQPIKVARKIGSPDYKDNGGIGK